MPNLTPCKAGDKRRLPPRGSNGIAMFKPSELERFFRDARCGRFHPANANLAREIVAKAALGIDRGERPRWG